MELGHLKKITTSVSQLQSKVFKNNKKLKGNFFSITETLTALRMKKPTEARNPFGLTNVWTQYGKILCKKDNRLKGFLTNCMQE